MPRWISTAHLTASTDAGELDEEAVAGGLDDPAGVLGYCGSISSRRCAVSAVRVPSSSALMSRL
jgi:hypothetical protein